MIKMKLDIILGPMFAGKSTELIRRIRRLDILQKQYIVLKPIIDTRYSKEHIVSHNNEKINCLSYEKIKDFIELTNLKNIDTVFIDEAQFFPDLKEGVIDILENKKKNVVIVGLDGDFNRNRFGQVLDLIPYCDTCVKFSALCKICNDGTPGIFSQKISGKDDQIEVGSCDLYNSVCRKHYLDFIKKDH